MARPSQNILRRQVNVKTYIIMFSVLFFLLFLLVSYFGYRVLNYEYVHGKVNELSGYILAASDSSPFQLPFFNALGGILLFHVKVWWVYLSTACIVFIFMTSRNRNDFKNMEHGSARWANKEEIKRFQKDKTGIPLAKDTFLSVLSKIAANLNEIVIGGSGAGKTLRKIKADILQMLGSYVITDPKGELYRDCAKVLKKNGYEAIAKTAPNTAVLGAATRIDSDFISLLGDKYNPHAVLLDTDVTAIGTNIQAAVEEITQTYPYMRILVLTDEDDDYDYPVDCIVQGQFSNIKLKEILTSMASGNTFSGTDSDDADSDQDERLPHRIKLNSHELDKLSASQTSRRRFGFPLIHINPIILAGTAAGVLVLVVIVLAVMKGVSGAGQVSTPDEAATTAPFFLFDTQPPTQAMTEDYDYPTLPVEYDTTATVPTTVQPPTIAPEPTAAPRTVPPTTRSEEKPTAAPQTSSSPSSGGSSSGGSSSGGSSSSGGNNSGNSNGTSQNSQPDTQTYGGEPVVSYDNNGRYSNSGGNAVSSVKLNYSSKTLEVDDAIQLSAAVSPSNANQSVSWSSSNSAVVSVNNGKITAKKVGKATITATAGNGKSASCEVTVRKKEQTDSVHLSASEYHISVGQTITVTLYGTSKVTWSVSNSNPVTFTSNKNEAKVKARRKGNTQLYAKDNATGKVYICDIYVG